MKLGQLAWLLLARIAAAAIAGAMLGWAFGRPWAGVAAALGFVLSLQLFHLIRLDQWLRDRAGLDPPDAPGLWGDVTSRVVRLHRRKRYHKQRLMEVFRELRRSTAAIPDGVVLLDPKARIVWFNRMAGNLLGLQRPADLGMGIANLVRDPAFGRYLNEGQYGEPMVIAGPARHGLSVSIQIVPYGGDQRLILARDVSHQVQLENMRKDFVANASHELRSPLTVIIGYMETIDQDDIEPLLKEPLAEMRRQAERMNAIIRDLLELSRLDAGKGEVPADGDVIDVGALAAMLRKDVMARPAHPQVTLRMESDAAVVGHEGEIHSAFSNLVDNAAKYTPASGAIEIRWWVDAAGDGHFAVRDTGIGIPADHLPRLTERFYRVDEGRSRAKGGSGLGLAIVKHALQHHGATLTIESTAGSGSTFTCHFPARRISKGSGGSNMNVTSNANTALN